jgi:hypothetical protein
MATEETIFDREAKGPLPDGLQVVVIEIPIVCNGYKLKTQKWGDLDGKAEVAVEAICNLVDDTIGSTTVLMAGQRSIAGASDHVRLRFELLAAPAVIAKWLASGGGAMLPTNSLLHLKHESTSTWLDSPSATLKIFESLSHRFAEDDGTSGSDFSFKGEYAGSFEGAWNDKTVLEKPGVFARWALVAQATDEDLENFSELSDACNGDVATMESAMERHDAEPPSQSFLVPGLIPRGVITLLGGNRKIGKSTVAVELAVAVARREKEWLGFPIDTSQRGFSVCCFGEDHPGEVTRRIERMTGAGTPPLLQTIPYDGREIDDILSDLGPQKVSFLSIDPARKYYRGDEDGSDAPSEFLTKLETFAQAKNCAVLLSHHLKKNVNPRTLSEVAIQLRGSSVFVDRARVTLAMLRKGNETHIGIPAPDGVPLHNFGPSTMFSGVRRLGRNEANFRHISLDAPTAASTPKAAHTPSTDSVLGAARGLIGAGERVTRTGKAGLFERKPAALAGMPRAAVRSAVDVLIGQGLLDSDDGGVLTLPKFPSPDTMADLIG